MANTLDEVTTGVFDRAVADLKLSARIASYANDPVLFAEEVLGIKLWSRQRQMVESVINNTHTIVRSCHGSGKSLTSSVIVCWWIATHPVGSAIAVTTAPTFAQVSTILFAEIRRHHATAEKRYNEGLSPIKLPGYVNQQNQWKNDDGMTLAFGRAPADAANGFQGIHRRYVLVILDEACGISEELFTAAEAITTTAGSRILAVGNPDDPVTMMGSIFRTDPTWNKIAISAFDSPNFTIEHLNHKPEFCEECAEHDYYKLAELDKDVDDDLRKFLIQKSWVDARRLAWSEQSPLWKSKVLGEFPDQSVNTLFSIGTLYKGHDTDITPLTDVKRILGVDVAGFGVDYSTIYINLDGQIRFVDSNSFGDATITSRWIHQTALGQGAEEVRIDAGGMGQGIIDQVVQLAQTSYTVIAMKGNAPSPDRFRWVNSRAYWWDDLRQRMFNGQVDIDPTDKHLEEELGAVQYHFKNRLQSLQIESKDDMRSRGLKSPDYADAAVYASADLTHLENNPFGSLAPGTRFSVDPAELLGLFSEISPY